MPVDYFWCKRKNTDLTQAFINTACAFYYYNTTAHVLLQYRSVTYTTFLPSLKYTLIQTECGKTKSKHLNASKCIRTSFVAKEIIRTNSEKKSKTSTTSTAQTIKFKWAYYLLKGSVKFSFTNFYATFTVCKVNLYATVTPLRKVCVMRFL